MTLKYSYSNIVLYIYILFIKIIYKNYKIKKLI
uniref:Uncharacterized protein n=1 Tax=viral metagenome TaxID=1070528 RepID=A0A6C0EHH2_9ZZZZ